jgi:hypothetical protein
MEIFKRKKQYGVEFLEVNGKVSANDGVLAPKKWQTKRARHWHPIDFFAQQQKVND